MLKDPFKTSKYYTDILTHSAYNMSLKKTVEVKTRSIRPRKSSEKAAYRPVKYAKQNPNITAKDLQVFFVAQFLFAGLLCSAATLSTWKGCQNVAFTVIWSRGLCSEICNTTINKMPSVNI